jgi:hypothetical protein
MWASKEEIRRRRLAAVAQTELADQIKDGTFDTIHKVAPMVACELNLQRDLCHRGKGCYLGEQGNSLSLIFLELAWKALGLEDWPQCEKCSDLAAYPHENPLHCAMHSG